MHRTAYPSLHLSSLHCNSREQCSAARLSFSSQLRLARVEQKQCIIDRVRRSPLCTSNPHASPPHIRKADRGERATYFLVDFVSPKDTEHNTTCDSRRRRGALLLRLFTQSSATGWSTTGSSRSHRRRVRGRQDSGAGLSGGRARWKLKHGLTMR